jgi:hypothetical protein
MKKSIKLFVPAVAIIGGLLIACNGSSVDNDVELRMHHGIFATYSSRTNVTPYGAYIQTDVNYVGVLLDEDDTILDFKLDVMQVKVAATSETEMLVIGDVWPDTEDTKSKWELGSDYNMAPVANLGEWDVQAYVVEQEAIGMNYEDFLAELEENSTFDASISITLEGFYGAALDALQESNVKSFTVKQSQVDGLKLGIGMYGEQENRMVGPNRRLNSNINFTTAIFSAETIVESKVDVIQIPYAINANNDKFDVSILTTAVQVDVENTKILSKATLGELYNMGPVANLGEWDVQAAALEEWMVGKEANDLADVLISGKFPVDDQEDIGVSVTVSYFTHTYVEAYEVTSGRTLSTDE